MHRLPLARVPSGCIVMFVAVTLSCRIHHACDTCGVVPKQWRHQTRPVATVWWGLRTTAAASAAMPAATNAAE